MRRRVRPEPACILPSAVTNQANCLRFGIIRLFQLMDLNLSLEKERRRRTEAEEAMLEAVQAKAQTLAENKSLTQQVWNHSRYCMCAIILLDTNEGLWADFCVGAMGSPRTGPRRTTVY